MKKIKMTFIKLKDKTKKTCTKIKEEHLIKKYFQDNILFITFVITTLLCSTILRFFCMKVLENYLSIRAILADLAVIIFVGSFGYLFKPKNRFPYFLGMNIFLSAICMINSVYYTFYTSFASISMLSLTQYIGQVGDAVVENVLQLKDLVYILSPLTMIFVNNKLKKSNYYKKIEVKSERKKKTIKTLSVSTVLAVVFLVTMTPLDVSRFAKQWNKEYIVMRFGIYVYQTNDLIVSLKPKLNSMFGFDKANKEFQDYFAEKDDIETNKYTNVFEGKNVIVIHAESMQTNGIGLEFNGQPVTPTLNKLVEEGMYFSNFYSQVGVGTSSDAELTFNTSLMPTKSGTAFVSYADRTYNSIPKLLKEKGYYTFSMHANNAGFWNRQVMHQTLGYDRFFSKKDYEIKPEDVIGLGLNDNSFFDQSLEKIKKIDKENENWYGTLIMLTNHTPFSEVDKYGDFPVDIRETVQDEYGNEVEKVHPYMEGTKLGNYYKSYHYADLALGRFIENLDKEGLLEDTVLVIYGDHDARLKRSDYNLQHNYDLETDEIMKKTDPRYKEYDSYQYELGRKVPFIIWTKDMEGTYMNKEITNVMGMYDVMPTLGNMLGFYNPYQFGHDIFNIKEDNIVIFSNANWVTNKVYYNSQKGEYLSLTNEAVSEEEIKKNNEYTNKILDVSNDIIVYDLLKKRDNLKE